jgi:hypothetical protein
VPYRWANVPRMLIRLRFICALLSPDASKATERVLGGLCGCTEMTPSLRIAPSSDVMLFLRARGRTHVFWHPRVDEGQIRGDDGHEYQLNHRQLRCLTIGLM